jgi:hypothetical protein
MCHRAQCPVRAEVILATVLELEPADEREKHGLALTRSIHEALHSSLATDIHSTPHPAELNLVIAKMWRSETSAGASSQISGSYEMKKTRRTRSASLTCPPVMGTRQVISAHQVKLSLPRN